LLKAKKRGETESVQEAAVRDDKLKGVKTPTGEICPDSFISFYIEIKPIRITLTTQQGR
jgi:hypothetical protein